MALGCSTNSMLHLPAIAHEAGVDLKLEKANEISKRTPNLCHLAPAGHTYIEELNEAGGVYAVMNELNKKVLSKMLQESGLEFHPLLECGIYVYMWKGHPLADKEEISIEEQEEYPCLSFEQGEYNSFYFAEEVLSTYEYKRLIKANDRATMLNLMVGLNGYTLCSGIICEELNGNDYAAVPLAESEKMRIGYIRHKGIKVSPIGELYVDILKKSGKPL